jgi:hypothetical protein
MILRLLGALLRCTALAHQGPEREGLRQLASELGRLDQAHRA